MSDNLQKRRVRCVLVAAAIMGVFVGSTSGIAQTLSPSAIDDAAVESDLDTGAATGFEVVAASAVGGALAFAAPVAGLATTFAGPRVAPNLFRSSQGWNAAGITVTAAVAVGGAVVALALLVPLFALTNGTFGAAIFKAVVAVGSSVVGGVVGGWLGLSVPLVALPLVILIVWGVRNGPRANEFEHIATWTLAASVVGWATSTVIGAVAGGIIGPTIAMDIAFPLGGMEATDAE